MYPDLRCRNLAIRCLKVCLGREVVEMHDMVRSSVPYLPDESVRIRSGWKGHAGKRRLIRQFSGEWALKPLRLYMCLLKRRAYLITYE